jgi:hypothetical protein
MKKTIQYVTLISLIVLSLSSCSSSPNDPPVTVPVDDTVPTTCMPLKTLNFWDYTVENRASNVPASTAADHLFVGNDVVQNMITYKQMQTTLAPNGFFSSILANNKLRIDGTRLKVTGVFNNTIIPNVNVAINLSDFIILKENASFGEALSSQSGQVIQSISGYPVTFDYILKSESDGTLATYTTNTGVTYTNVKKTKIKLNATATTVVQGVTLPALSTQDVIISTLYFVPGKGMVYNSRNFSYQLNTLVATQLQIPASSSQLQEEYLGTFDVSH